MVTINRITTTGHGLQFLPQRDVLDQFKVTRRIDDNAWYVVFTFYFLDMQNCVNNKFFSLNTDKNDFLLKVTSNTVANS